MKNMIARRALALLGALVLCMSLAIPAFAADGPAYTAIDGGSTTIKKVLRMPADATVPNVTFTFTITPGSPMEAGDGTLEVKAGPTGATIGDAVITAGQNTTTDAAVVGSGTLTGTQKAAVTDVTVDLSNVTFNEPGVYRYVITENSTPAIPGVSYDHNSTKYLDVYVEDQNGELEIGGYVLRDTAAAPGVDEETITKPIGFINDYSSVSLTLSKTVTGNQGSKDKYFKFTVALTSLGNGTTVTVDWSDAEQAPYKSASTTYSAADMAAANGESSWTADASGAITHDVYLKDGQSIELTGLCQGAKYTITEVAEDYSPSYTKTPGATTATSGNSCAETTGMSESHTVAFTNGRNGAVPTGIVLTALPGAIVLGLGGAGFALVGAKRARKEDQE